LGRSGHDVGFQPPDVGETRITEKDRRRVANKGMISTIQGYRLVLAFSKRRYADDHA
jgi:hypothetical protein